MVDTSNEGQEKTSILVNETNDDIIDALDFSNGQQSNGLDDDYEFNSFKSAENGSTEQEGGEDEEDHEKSGFVHDLSETLRKAVDFFSKAFSSSHESENATVPEHFDVGSFEELDNETSVTRGGPTAVSSDGQNLQSDDGTGTQFSTSTLPHIETIENGLQETWITYPLKGTSITHPSEANPKTYTGETTWTPEGNWTSVAVESSQQQHQLPTWVDAGGMCFADFVNSEESATCMTGNASMETALLDIFNDTIIRKLAKKCMPGEWCLSHHPHWKHEPQTNQGFCSVLPCFQNWKNHGGCPVEVFQSTILVISCIQSSAFFLPERS